MRELTITNTHQVKVLLLGDGGILSLSVARALAEEGIKNIHEFSVNHVPVEMSKNSRYLQSYTTFDSFEKLNPNRLIDSYSKGPKLVLLPITVEASRWITDNQKHLKSFFFLPPQPKKESIDLVSNKWRLHEWLRENEFNSPKTVAFNEKDGIFDRHVLDVGFPQILKSKTEIPFKNILYIESPDSFDGIKNKIKGPLEDNIIQKVVPGVDRDVSLLARYGRIIAFTMQTPVKTRNLLYAKSVKFFKDQRFLKLIQKIISELKWNGVAHLDFRYIPATQEYFLIDFNARYWGTLLGSVCAGANIPYLHVQQALNKQLESNEYKTITFMMNREAIEELYNKLLRKKESTKEFRLRNSELRFSLKDPLPEIYRRYSNNPA